jgi:hypothetical protein
MGAGAATVGVDGGIDGALCVQPRRAHMLVAAAINACRFIATSRKSVVPQTMPYAWVVCQESANCSRAIPVHKVVVLGAGSHLRHDIGGAGIADAPDVRSAVAMCRSPAYRL